MRSAIGLATSPFVPKKGDGRHASHPEIHHLLIEFVNKGKSILKKNSRTCSQVVARSIRQFDAAGPSRVLQRAFALQCPRNMERQNAEHCEEMALPPNNSFLHERPA